MTLSTELRRLRMIMQAVHPCVLCGTPVDQVCYVIRSGPYEGTTVWVVDEEHWAPCGAVCCAPFRGPETLLECRAGLRHGWEGGCARCGPRA